MKRIKNIFIEGCSNSGKDTLANYFKNDFGFFKIRIADTIKRIICETLNLTFDELEELKRTKPELRLLHNEVGKYLDSKNGTVNRINQIINRTALDFQHEKDIENLNLCVCDARGFDNSVQLLKAGFLGFFLMRDTREFGDSEHWTEKTLARDKRIIELAKDYHKQMVIVFNFNTRTPIYELAEYKNYFIDDNGREFMPAIINAPGSTGEEFINNFNYIVETDAFEHQIIDIYLEHYNKLFKKNGATKF